MAKPMKTLELHYPVIQFLIKTIIPVALVGYEMIKPNEALHASLAHIQRALVE